MFGVQIGRTVSSCSLLLLASFGLGTDYAELQRRVAQANSGPELKQVLTQSKSEFAEDEALRRAAQQAIDNPTDENAARVRDMVDVRARVAGASKAPSAGKAVAGIKGSVLYKDNGVGDDSNWVDGAMARLARLIPRPNPRPINAPSLGFLPGIIVPMMWGLLGLAVAVLLYFAFRHFSWKGRLRSKGKALLEDDEPEKTLDEWLAMADSLAAEGRYREAVRALFLACLVRFDEERVARFIRGETNWEHLARITASPRRPADLDFLPPTKAFDQIWYGHRTRGLPDVEQFRIWYAQVTEALKGAKAA